MGRRRVSLAAAAIAVLIVVLVRGLPDRQKQEAAEGGDLPINGADRPQPSPGKKDPARGRRDLPMTAPSWSCPPARGAIPKERPWRPVRAAVADQPAWIRRLPTTCRPTRGRPCRAR